MSDIVELLQKPSWTTRWRNAAADEIEHLMRAHDDMSDTIETLRARVKELEEAAMWAIDHVSRCNSPEWISEAKAHVRAALKEGESNA